MTTNKGTLWLQITHLRSENMIRSKGIFMFVFTIYCSFHILTVADLRRKSGTQKLMQLQFFLATEFPSTKATDQQALSESNFQIIIITSNMSLRAACDAITVICNTSLGTVMQAIHYDRTHYDKSSYYPQTPPP